MEGVVTFACSLIVIYVVISLYLKLTRGECVCNDLLIGKVVLVTGSDKGIGYETVLNLARRQARIIMACRDFENAEKVAEKIKQMTGNAEVIAKKLDVSSLACVKEFAENFIRDEKSLHVLILNAGIPGPKDNKIERTSEGFEKVFVTNYLGHFLLTMLLLDLLKKSQPSRIISVSSMMHVLTTSLDLTNLNCEVKPYKLLYSRSKLLLILFTTELSRQLLGTDVTVNCLHPGAVRTNIFNKLSKPWRIITNISSSLFFKSPRDGAQTTIHLAVSRELERISGLYFSDCKSKKPSKIAQNAELAKKVFEISENYCAHFLKT